MQRGPADVVPGVRAGPGVQQKSRRGSITVVGGLHQGRRILQGPGLDVRPPLDQQLRRLGVPVPGQDGMRQGRHPVHILEIHIRAQCQQAPDPLGVARCGGDHQRRHALAARLVHRGPGGDQRLEELRPLRPSRGDHQRRQPVPGPLHGVGPEAEQERDGLGIVVGRGHHQGGDRGHVSVVGVCAYLQKGPQCRRPLGCLEGRHQGRRSLARGFVDGGAGRGEETDQVRGGPRGGREEQGRPQALVPQADARSPAQQDPDGGKVVRAAGRHQGRLQSVRARVGIGPRVDEALQDVGGDGGVLRCQIECAPVVVVLGADVGLSQKQRLDRGGIRPGGDSPHQGGVAVGGSDVRIGAGLRQKPQDGRVRPLTGRQERGDAAVVGLVGRGPGSQQKLDAMGVGPCGGRPERGPTPAVPGPGRCPGPQQGGHDPWGFVQRGREVQGRPALRVREVGVGAGPQEGLGDGGARVVGRGQHQRRQPLESLRGERGAPVEQAFDEPRIGGVLRRYVERSVPVREGLVRGAGPQGRPQLLDRTRGTDAPQGLGIHRPCLGR